MDNQAPFTDPHAEIREEVRKLCARFPGEYWRKRIRNALPDSVRARADRGRLSGRAESPRIWRAGLPLWPRRRSSKRFTPRAVTRGMPRPDVHHGNDFLRHGTDAQKKAYCRK